MYLTVTNLFTEEHTEIHGSPQQAEEQLRALFPGLLGEIPEGDFDEVLRVVNRLYGYSIVIIDSSDYHKGPRVPSRRPINDDPWEREIDAIPDLPN